MMLFITLIVVLYILLILWFTKGMGKVNNIVEEALAPKITFTICIPFRNESEHLPKLLDSLNTIEYPETLFEIILINDISDDNSVPIIEDFTSINPRLNIKIIENKRTSNAPKKDAITTAIKAAKNDWILTTDADCLLPPKWLKLFDVCIQKQQPKMIAGPVTYLRASSFLEIFQLLDILSLQGITIGAFGQKKPFLCNGANLAYEKNVFNDVNGFSGNDDIASGDDIFLLEKIVKSYPEKVVYLKNEASIVKTYPQASWKELIHQRIRWAAKASAYKNLIGKISGLLVFVVNLSLLLLIIASTVQWVSYSYSIGLFLIKLIVDFPILHKTAAFFKQKKHLKGYFFSSLLYPFFSIYIVLRSLFTNYTWKGREFKK